MIFCTACGAENAEGTKFCVRCGATLAPAQSAPGSWQSQSSELNPPPQPQSPPPVSGASSYQEPSANSAANNPYAAPSAAPPPYNQGYNPSAPSYQMQPVMNAPRGGGLFAVGEKRDPVMVLVLSLVTCGIYGIYWWIVTGNDIKNALGREDINPTMDIVLAFVTCGIWLIYMHFKYPQLILEMQDRTGVPRNDISVISILLAVFGLGLVAQMMMQTELNKVYDAAGQRG